MQKEKSLSRNKDVNKWGVIYKKPSGTCLTAGGLRFRVLIVNIRRRFVLSNVLIYFIYALNFTMF